MPQQVVLVALGVLLDLEAEDAQHVAGLPVEVDKVLQDVRVEGRAVRAHLGVRAHLELSRPERGAGGVGGGVTGDHSPGRRTASPQVCGWTSCG